MRNKTVFQSIPLVVAFGFATGTVLAEPLTANQVLQQFNLVVINNATSTSEVDGRTFVGGSLNGGIYDAHPFATPTSDFAGLTVLGDANHVMVNGFGVVTGGNLSNSTVNSGSSIVLGTSSGNNFNGGFNSALASGTAATAATSTNFGSLLSGLSTQLSQLGSTGSTVTIDNGKVTFNAVANAGGLAVFDLSSIDTSVFSSGEFQFNLNGAKTVIINSDEVTPTITANFLGGSAQGIGATTLWNFYDATDLTINNQWGGSILAPLAAFRNGNNIEGGVFVNSLAQSGEIHLQAFTGQIPAVPEPETYAMFLAGLGFLGFITRRRSDGHAV